MFNLVKRFTYYTFIVPNVSKSIGITQSHYATYENGHNTIPITRLIKLSKLYNVSLDYLMGKCS